MFRKVQLSEVVKIYNENQTYIGKIVESLKDESLYSLDSLDQKVF